jgi:AraC-like DNA-binding protein
MEDLTTKPSARTNIRPQILRYLALVLTERGVDLAQVFPATLPGPSELDDLASRVSFQQGMAVVRNAISVTGDPALGLKVGGRQSITALGLVGLAALSAATRLEAMSTALSYQQIAGSMIDLEAMENSDGDLMLVAQSKFSDASMLRFLVEEAFSSIVRFTETTFHPENGLVRLEVTFDPSEQKSQYDSIFNCPVSFKSSRNAMTFSWKALNKPMRTADAVVHKQVRQILDREIRQELIREDFLGAVEDEIRRTLETGINQEQIARRLGMSDRSFRRKLATLGMSFRDLTSRVRQVRAIELLTASDVSLDTIAFTLGMSDTRSFRRAFRRWTDQSPAQFRQQMRAAET